MIDIRIDMSRFNLDDVIQCLTNAGYIISNDFDYTREVNGFAYLGYNYNNDKHKFLVIIHDNMEDTYIVTTILVWLGHKGYLEAEYAAMPQYESGDPAAAMSEFIRIKREN